MGCRSRFETAVLSVPDFTGSINQFESGAAHGISDVGTSDSLADKTVVMLKRRAQQVGHGKWVHDGIPYAFWDIASD